ncbi:MAG: DUF3769 domain-containing protein [Cyanobacteria bacterium REEB459]|nr:DUF3769 domain-containing protein [Cyanobacteria bacterium REEB459]
MVLPLNLPVPPALVASQPPATQAPATSAPLLSPAANQVDPGSPGLPQEPGAALPAAADPAAFLVLRADQQQYQIDSQMIRANGDVLVQFGNGQISADHLWINLNQRQVKATGNVVFTRNQQVMAGDRATYNLLQGAGTLTNARGELSPATAAEDFSASPTAPGEPASPPRNQASISQITSPGDLSLSTLAGQSWSGDQAALGRVRFQSSYLAFDAKGWYGDDIRLTNDPLIPAELELRGERLRLTPLNPDEDQLCVDNPRVVFDQGLAIPLLRNCFLLERGRLPANALNPLPVSIGYDGRDRGGLFIEREFQLLKGSPWQLSLAPQLYLSRWLGNANLNLLEPANLGLVARLNGPLGPRTTLRGVVSLPGLDLEQFNNRLRVNLRAQQVMGDHRLSLEYTYRDRLFNGSLGFQDVQTSAGILLESPLLSLGNTGLNLSYQASGQYVTANTDRPQLLPPGSQSTLTSLLRFQALVDLSRGFTLWQEPAPENVDFSRLRYSPRPPTPNLTLTAGLRAIATYYTSNDLQESLEGRITLSGQLGHLVADYLDYTQFNIGISSSLAQGDNSPFLFDRAVDQNVFSAGILQQIYGPFLLGLQTSFNINTGQQIDTALVAEYRRRTYGIAIRYSPTQEAGVLEFRLSNFNW